MGLASTWIAAASCSALALIGCSGEADVDAGDGARATPPGSVTNSLDRVAGDLHTAAALDRFEELMGPGTFREELTVEPHTCPLGDAADLFQSVAEEVDDRYAATVAGFGETWALLLSVPDRGVTVASCGVSFAEFPIDFLRLEVRPGEQSIESMVEVAMDPSSVTVEQGAAHRGGNLYRYCGTRPDSGPPACVVGWRNSDLDVALAANGTTTAGLDLDELEAALILVLEDVLHQLAERPVDLTLGT